MSRSKILFCITGLVAAACLWYAQSTRKANRSNIELLERKIAAQRDSLDQPIGTRRQSDFEAFASRGKPQPLPDSLVAEPDPGGYWFVGMPGSDHGVEIPFAPGHIPKSVNENLAGQDSVVTSPSGNKAMDNESGFLGADACKECHSERHATFKHTAHYRTSSLATPSSVKGHFEDDRNTLTTTSPDVYFEMVNRDGDLFQRVSFFDWKFEVPFHIVTGSSKMAQTYLYWHGDGLYQMNVSYLSSVDEWINSPGYVDGDAAYARTIGKRCLECHTTYASSREEQGKFDPDSIIFGVSCERCHGPGKTHVDYHRSHPDERNAKSISLPSALTRQQQLEICAQCHAGINPLKGEPYQFRPGDSLDMHYEEIDKEDLGSVHSSNQLERLKKSGCFLQSDMTCTDCHNPHKNERGDLKLFSQRCLKCHQTAECSVKNTVGVSAIDFDLEKNCVDCHMPVRGSEKLWMKTAEGRIFPPLRDHNVRVDRQATESFLRAFQKNDNSRK